MPYFYPVVQTCANFRTQGITKLFQEMPTGLVYALAMNGNGPFWRVKGWHFYFSQGDAPRIGRLTFESELMPQAKWDVFLKIHFTTK